MGRSRLTALVSVFPLIAALCVVAYKFGPTPTAVVERVQAGGPVAVKPEKAVESQLMESSLFQLFGISQAAVATGQVKMTPADFLNSIEARYRERGYRKLEYARITKSKLRKSSKLRQERNANKYFQRDDLNGIGSISAIGTDADYNSDGLQSPEPFSFSTLVVTSPDGGAAWSTYRTEADKNKLGQLRNLDEGDFPGTDPANIPRLAGLQRIYALTSANGFLAIYRTMETETSLIMRYLAEMPRHGWRLNPQATSNANNLAPGVMCFTQGPRISMIWVSRSKESTATHVTISSH